MNADQVLLSMFAHSQDWYQLPIIKLGKHKDLQDKLGLKGKYAAYKDFFAQMEITNSGLKCAAYKAWLL